MTEISDALRTFYDDVAARSLQPLWTQHGLLTPNPSIADAAHVWRWRDVRPLAERAGELIAIDRGGDRRVLAMANPGLDGQPYATRTLWAAIQYLGAGEGAPPHRHTPGAIRYVLEGHGAFTYVDDEPISMEPGDLVVTPGWGWHAHVSSGDDAVIWFDGLDLPMIRALDAVFTELGGRDVPRAITGSTQGGAEGGQSRSPWAHRWATTDRTLDGLLATAADGHAVHRFEDPRTGADVLPTMRCAAHRLRAEMRTPTTRRSGSSVFVVFRGESMVVLDGVRYEVAPGDVFAVPSWCAVDMESLSDVCTLFSISDAPVLEALGLLRHEIWDRCQEVVRDG